MTDITLAPLELAAKLALTLGLAVFMGFAFEETYKREERDCPGGIRTFPMLAIAGASLYLIEPHWALAFIVGLFAIALWLHAFLRGESGSHGASLMLPAANLIAYLIGPIAITQPPWLAVAISVAAVLLLSARERLHRLIQLVPRDEVMIAGEFLVLVGIVLPLVPNTPVTALTPLTPYHVWLAVVAICSLSYANYLLQKYAPARESSLLPAVLGGIYSSTVTTIVLAKRQREAATARSDLSAGIIAATAIMYIRLGVVIGIFDLHLAIELAPALGVLFLVGAAMATSEWRRRPQDLAETNLSVPPTNPLQISTAVIFAGIFIVISLASGWVSTTFGAKGILILAAIVGASDIDPFVLSIAQGGVVGMSTAALSAAVLVAASSNNVLKAVYALGFGGMRTTVRPAVMLFALAVLGVGAAVVYVAVLGP